MKKFIEYVINNRLRIIAAIASLLLILLLFYGFVKIVTTPTIQPYQIYVFYFSGFALLCVIAFALLRNYNAVTVNTASNGQIYISVVKMTNKINEAERYLDANTQAINQLKSSMGQLANAVDKNAHELRQLNKELNNDAPRGTEKQ